MASTTVAADKLVRPAGNSNPFRPVPRAKPIRSFLATRTESSLPAGCTSALSTVEARASASYP